VVCAEGGERKVSTPLELIAATIESATTYRDKMVDIGYDLESYPVSALDFTIRRLRQIKAMLKEGAK
jgi:hypothetical protein